MAHTEITSSTGECGVSRRSYDRIYINGTYSSDPEQFGNNYNRLNRLLTRSPKITRVVSRSIIGPSVLERVVDDPQVRNDLEVHLPLREFGYDEDSLVYIARNNQRRISQGDLKKMSSEVQGANVERTDPIKSIEELRNNGYIFTAGNLTLDQMQKVFSLWGPTFNWTEEQIVNLNDRLREESETPDKYVWFSGVFKGDEVVSLAMAERLTLPGKDGKPVDLIETTEWVTAPKYQNNGYMPAALHYLNAQIIRDMRNKGIVPVIYAECNVQSKAYRAGMKSGLQMPDTSVASQILQQNVGIGDGLGNQPSGLRDFAFMYMSRDVMENVYDPAVVSEILTICSSNNL